MSSPDPLAASPYHTSAPETHNYDREIAMELGSPHTPLTQTGKYRSSSKAWRSFVLCNLDFVIPPHFATLTENLVNLKQCPVSFSFADPDSQVRVRLLKRPRVWLFGTSLQLSVPPIRPSLTQCERCQALGHGTKGCKAPAMCAKCAGNHRTINHRKSCADCATKANESDLCPHPRHCRNCGGDHPATFSTCPKKRRFCGILSGQEQDFPILPEEEEY
ncbi:hypothetical protein M0805_001013 [Coniferiporia weirii]|nr:hypothetical protein M0805_001013 [Coniferiporia weirii]